MSLISQTELYIIDDGQTRTAHYVDSVSYFRIFYMFNVSRVIVVIKALSLCLKLLNLRMSTIWTYICFIIAYFHNDWWSSQRWPE